MSIIEGSAPVRTAPPSDEARLRQSSRDLEGVFVEQLFKAMRETVPENELFGGGGGEQMFTGMMDAHLAAEVPQGWNDGLGEAIYRQLRAALAGGAEAADAAADLAPAFAPPTPSLPLTGADR
jgi:peptidoglycan hydrolase FlgJ